jgi:hypothetical protein
MTLAIQSKTLEKTLRASCVFHALQGLGFVLVFILICDWTRQLPNLNPSEFNSTDALLLRALLVPVLINAVECFLMGPCLMVPGLIGYYAFKYRHGPLCIAFTTAMLVIGTCHAVSAITLSYSQDWIARLVTDLWNRMGPRGRIRFQDGVCLCLLMTFDDI